MKGDRDLVYYLNPIDPSFTHYGGYFSGRQINDDKVKAEVLDTFTVSAMQMASPDPIVISKLSKIKFNGFCSFCVDKERLRKLRFDSDTKNIG